MVGGDVRRLLYLGGRSAGHALDVAADAYEVRAVTSVREAATALEDEAVGVDCVVVDARGASGVAALDRLRRVAPTTPVILLVATDDVARRALDAGASDVVRLDATAEASERIEVLTHRLDAAVARVRASSRAAETQRLSRLAREVMQAVVEATTREQVEGAVCTHLADADIYPYVWCGRVDEETESITKFTDASGAADDVDAVRVAADLGGGPAAQSMDAREVVVVQDVREDPAFAPWRDATLDAGFQSVAAVPIRNGDDVYGAICLFARDRWAFDAAEQALLSDLGEAVGHATHAAEVRAQYRRFREAVEHAGHSIYITDVDGTIRYVNPAFERTTGYSAAEAVGRDPSILKSGEYGAEFYGRLWGTILDGEVWNDDIVNRRKDGERYYVEQTIAPILDDDDIDGFVAVNNDITTLKEKEAALERQNDRLEALADIVSHDIRNPLNVATGRLELARETGDRSHLDEARSALGRIDQLLDDLLSLARTGRHVGEREAVPLAALAREAWSTVATEGATLRIEASGEVRADRSRLRQALENLFRNAVEHGSVGSRHTARSDDHTERVGSNVTVTVGTLDGGFFVEDDGPGIPEADRVDVFDTGHTTDRDGTGLGLAIVARVAEAHGWSLTVTEGAAGGARFEFTGVAVDGDAEAGVRRVEEADST